MKVTKHAFVNDSDEMPGGDPDYYMAVTIPRIDGLVSVYMVYVWPDEQIDGYGAGEYTEAQAEENHYGGEVVPDDQIPPAIRGLFDPSEHKGGRE